MEHFRHTPQLRILAKNWNLPNLCNSFWDIASENKIFKALKNIHSHLWIDENRQELTVGKRSIGKITPHKLDSNHDRNEESFPKKDVYSYAEDIDRYDDNDPALASYKARIEFLKDEAALDEIAFNNASRVDFHRFIKSKSNIRRGSLFLMSNGNLRIVWRGAQESRLGIEFLGGGMLQYLIFRRHHPEAHISRVAGRDTFAKVNEQIDRFELSSILYE